jgi:hypothetical protein
MRTVTFTYNRTLGTADNGNLKKVTPFEMLKGYPPDLGHLRIFGCKAYAYNFDITRKKLDIGRMLEFLWAMMNTLQHIVCTFRRLGKL